MVYKEVVAEKEADKEAIEKWDSCTSQYMT